MSSLRRDLIERRLWPLAVVLIAAIVAVPFLLAGHSQKSKAALADSAAPVPAGAQTAEGSSTVATTGSTTHRAASSSSTRDPFGGGASGGSGTTSASANSGASSGASSGATGSTPTQPASSASVGSAGAAPSSSGGTSSSSGSTSSPTTTVTTTATAPSTTTTSTTASQTGRWTVYDADIRFQAPGRKETIAGIARYTPLPAATWPRVMFMGITTDGRDAVFALGAGVTAKGKATCHPSHDSCTLISLRAGASERVSWPFKADEQRTMELTVKTITKQIITNRNEAVAAVARHSQIGLCELQIGDPIQYQYRSSGQLKSVTNSEPACTKAMKKVALAFPGTTQEYGEVAFPGTTAQNGQVTLPGLNSEDGQ